jgi:hypothetical protein
MEPATIKEWYDFPASLSQLLDSCSRRHLKMPRRAWFNRNDKPGAISCTASEHVGARGAWWPFSCVAYKHWDNFTT